MSKRKTKKNPMLMLVNPGNPAKLEQLWKEAKQQKSSLSRKEFDAGIKQFLNQHGHLPDSCTLIDVPGLDPKIKVVIPLGDVDKIHYKPHRKSRKAPYKYEHKTTDEKLLTDASGKTKILHGNCVVKPDGWLHK